MSAVKDFWMFMKERKKFWLAPVIIVFLLLGFAIAFASTSSAGAFVYTLF
ncbi:MAG: hypothetical protein ACI9U0_000151 [Flavobacteriales bacterium]|jgi:hypothetical protein|tara:strand:- start:7887 stop:8036 length:150 start_codon:yes stop_codon:yes gene_type:complete